MCSSRDNKIACFSLGSNLGDRIGHLEQAQALMADIMGMVEIVSRVYQSPSWGYSSDHVFYNCCILMRTRLEPLSLLETALQVEHGMGRVRQGGGYSDRIIDIDLLIYGEHVLDHPTLILPHPRMHERRFVLVPLAEIAPDLLHPVSGLSMATLLERCQDPSEVIPV